MFDHHQKPHRCRAIVTRAALCALVLSGASGPVLAQAQAQDQAQDQNQDQDQAQAQEEAQEEVGGDPSATESPVECTDYVPPEHRNDTNRLALRGVACFEAGKYRMALGHYRAAYANSRAPFLLGAIGRAMQELDYPDLARHYYRAYLDASPTDSEGRQRIEQRLEVVKQRLLDETVPVTIASAPPRSRVYIIVAGDHWEDVGESPVTLQLSPGTHTIVMEKPGHVSNRRTITIEEGQEPQRVEVEVVPESATFHTTSRTFRKAGAYTMLGSVPILVGGATLIFMGIEETDDAENFGQLEDPQAPQRRLDALARADDYEKWGYITTGVGATVLITGGILYFVGASRAPDADPEPDSSSTLRPYVGPRDAGLTFTW